MKFVDSVEITIKSGDGGRGHVSFRKEKFVPLGGPDGGNGGKGGDIIFRTNPNISTLLDFRYLREYAAGNGGIGSKNRSTGKNGKNLIIKVPVGTVIYDADTNEILYDLTEANKDLKILSGGMGGRGNFEFRSATRQAPRFSQPGLPGKELRIRLELKLLADVGIIGFPNAGKSTLISVISDAKPKIADYPFTTLVPNLGIVKIGDYEHYCVADIPGLIEGAAEGKGLGHQFLKHVERCNVLLVLIDANSEKPSNDYKILMKELKKYNLEMLEKPQMIAITKVDSILPEKLDKLKRIKINKLKPILISSIARTNLDELKFILWNEIKVQKGL